MKQPPLFISFTGMDTADNLEGMLRLSKQYPVEWGLLVDEAQAGNPLFPSAEALSTLLATPGLRFAAHVCGEQAGFIANEPCKATVCLSGFQRLQVNHGFSGSSSDQIENTVCFGRTRGLRTMLQALGEFPDDARIDWLFDTSFGTGKTPEFWPQLKIGGAFCGYSGGINPENVTSVLEAINTSQYGQFWIDMESGIRTDGKFDLTKCESVCRAVYS